MSIPRADVGQGLNALAWTRHSWRGPPRDPAEATALTSQVEPKSRAISVTLRVSKRRKPAPRRRTKVEAAVWASTKEKERSPEDDERHEVEIVAQDGRLWR